MEQVRKYLDERIDEKINLIEDKLRNSFQAIKKDNEFIKDKIKELGESIASSNSVKVFREFDKFRADIKVDFNEIKSNVEKSISEFKKNEVEPLGKEFGALRKEISKQNVKEDIKNHLRKEVYAEFEKKIDKRFEKISSVEKEMKKDVSSYKKEVLGKTDYAIENLNATASGLRKNIEDEKEAFARVVKSRNSSLEREFSQLKNKISDKLYASFEERDEKIVKLERQVSYLKGKVNSDVPVIPEFKEVEKQRKEMEKAAKTLEVEAEKADKKKPFFIRVLTGKKASAKKDFKKLDRDDGKTFSSKIVDSMSKK